MVVAGCSNFAASNQLIAGADQNIHLELLFSRGPSRRPLLRHHGSAVQALDIQAKERAKTPWLFQVPRLSLQVNLA
jgi:hypothetical protein